MFQRRFKPFVASMIDTQGASSLCWNRGPERPEGGAPAQTPAPQPIFATVNEPWSSLWGFSHDEVIGNSMEILHGPRTEQLLVDGMVDATMQQRSFNGIITHYTKLGLAVLYRMTTEPVWLEQPAFIVRTTTIVDPQLIREAEAELQVARAEQALRTVQNGRGDRFEMAATTTAAPAPAPAPAPTPAAAAAPAVQLSASQTAEAAAEAAAEAELNSYVATMARQAMEAELERVANRTSQDESDEDGWVPDTDEEEDEEDGEDSGAEGEDAGDEEGGRQEGA